MDAATVKGVIDRLKARGLVELGKHDVDKRRLMVSLTAEGRAHGRAADPARGKDHRRDAVAAVAEGGGDAAEAAGEDRVSAATSLKPDFRLKKSLIALLDRCRGGLEPMRLSMIERTAERLLALPPHARSRFGAAGAVRLRLAPDRHGRLPAATRVRLPSTTPSRSTRTGSPDAAACGASPVGGASTIRSSARRTAGSSTASRTACPQLVDLDFGFTPATNVLQLQRAGLAGRRARRVLRRLVRHRQGRRWSSCRRSTSAATRRITGTSRRTATVSRRCWRSIATRFRARLSDPVGRWRTARDDALALSEFD